MRVIARTRLFPESATKSMWCGGPSIVTPKARALGPRNSALVPIPLAKPALPERPTIVVTV